MSIALAGGWHAARAQDPQSPQAQFRLEDETIDQMADAYIAIEDIQTQANVLLARTHDESDAREVMENAHEAMIRAVERTGLNLRDFNRLAELAALDPALGARIAARMRERRPI